MSFLCRISRSTFFISIYRLDIDTSNAGYKCFHKSNCPRRGRKSFSLILQLPIYSRTRSKLHVSAEIDNKPTRHLEKLNIIETGFVALKCVFFQENEAIKERPATRRTVL